MHSLDVWQTKQDSERFFGERMMPALKRLGLVGGSPLSFQEFDLPVLMRGYGARRPCRAVPRMTQALHLLLGTTINTGCVTRPKHGFHRVAGMTVPRPAQGSRRRSIFTSRLVNSAGDDEHPHVVDDVRRAILSGDEPPGTLIPIDAVAAFFGVSQIPVREALKVLHGEGLVDHVPRVGYSVAQLTFTEFRELYDVRQALEAAALRQAVPQATPAEDDDVRRWHVALGTAIASGDERGYHAASRSFHLAMIAPSRMQRLVHMCEAAWNITEPARPMARVGAGRRMIFHDDHDRMLEAFVARDPERLLAESARHFEHLRSAFETIRYDAALFRQE